MAAGEGVHRETGFLPDTDATDIGFVDGGFHLHVGKVPGNDKQFRRLQAGGHRLPRFDAALDHDAVNRRLDRGAFQIDAGRRQLCRALSDDRLAVPHLRLGRGKRRAGRIQVVLRRVAFGRRDEVFLHQGFLALVVALGVGQIGAGTRHFRLLHSLAGAGRV